MKKLDLTDKIGRTDIKGWLCSWPYSAKSNTLCQLQIFNDLQSSANLYPINLICKSSVCPSVQKNVASSLWGLWVPNVSPTFPQWCPKGAPKVPQRCPKGAPKVPRRCPEGAPKVPRRCPKGAQRYPEGAPKVPWRCPEGAPKVPQR